jgi:predicted dehydrogenase
MRQESKIRIGIIGAGTWSQYAHIPAIKDHPDAELVAICQRNPEKLKRVAEQWNIPHAYRDYREMLERQLLDGVIISTPHHVHYAQARLALERGLAVLLEKPMVAKASEARELITLAKQKGKPLLVGHPLPHTPIAQRARVLVQEGKLGTVKHLTAVFASPAAILFRHEPLPDDFGDYVPEHKIEPYSLTTYSSPDMGGGQNQTAVSHTASLLFWITGRRPTQVSAFMENDGCPVDAYDSITFRLDNGGLGTLASWGTLSYKQKGLHEFRIMGEQGLMILDATAATLSVRWQNGQVEDLARPAAKSEGEQGYFGGDPDIWPRFAPARNLVDVLLGRADPICTGEQTLPCVELVEAAAQSAKLDGQPIIIGG